MDSWIWDQVSLEFGDINVKGTIESEGSGKGGDNLGDQSVKVGVSWSLDIEISSADIVNGLVIDHDGDISVLEEGVSGEDGVVWLNNGGGNLWGWVDGESELGFFTVIDGKSLEEKGSESGTGSSSNSVEDKETLESCALIGKLSDSVEAEINDFFTDGVMSSGEVVGSIFFTGDKLFWMEQLSVGSGSNFIDDGWFEIEEDSSWDVFTSTSLGEEGVESIVTTTDRFIRWHLTVRLDSVLEAVQFPAGVAHLDAGLAHVERDGFTHLKSLLVVLGVKRLGLGCYALVGCGGNLQRLLASSRRK